MAGPTRRAQASVTDIQAAARRRGQVDVPPSEERLRLALDALPSLAAVVGATGELLDANEAWRQYGSRYGLTDLDIGSDLLAHWRSAAVDDARAAALADVLEEILRAARGGFEAEFEYVVDGQTHDAVVRFTPLGRPVTGAFVTWTDCTAWRALEARLAHAATHDALTGLANRALLLDRAEQAMHRIGRQGGEVALLFIDLDQFKDVNDRFGHEVGDGVLRGVTERLLGACRPTDTLARFGGDEFVLLLENATSPREVAEVGRRVHAVLAEPIPVAGAQIQVGASVGGSLTRHSGPVQTLLWRADMAMYRAKRQHRCDVEVDEV